VNPSFLLTVDVEDWFQVENFKQWIPFSSWSSRELRVEKNTHRLLDLLDSVKNDAPKATFFILGWLAERLPGLVREIHDRGHEVASHGYNHNLSSKQDPEELRKDLSDSKKLLEDIIGSPLYGYRAPSFSIDDASLKVVEECGYMYDSSFNSFAMHGRYGQVDLSDNGKIGIAIQVSQSFYELPISNLSIRNQILPVGGGGYFRLTPFPLFKLGVRKILKKDNAYLFYTHPWELDPEQPRVNEASPIYRFRHYVNLDKTQSCLSELLEDFSQCHFVTCRQYLENAKRMHT